MQRITSRNNPRLKEAARLVASSRDRRKAGRCVLEGEHVVDVFAARYGAPDTLIVSEEALTRPAVRSLAERLSDRTMIVPAALLGELATLPAGVGVMAVVAPPVAGVPAPTGFCLLLDDVQDPGNVGSMLRSAAAAGVERVLMSKRCAFAWSPKVLRAGQGAHFCVDIHEDVELPEWAMAYRQAGGNVVATVATGGIDLYATPLDAPIALCIGNEGAGVSPSLLALATIRVSIPMRGEVESLNAAAAAAVVLFECVRQRERCDGARRT
ncbi:MAG: RNA methyltransferase [Betaproteobacteria bacterium]